MGIPAPIDLRIRTQNPRDYTVQIRHAQTGAIVGTGIVVSPDKIVTCAHVLSHRVLGDLDADAGQHASARTRYDTALKIARSISRRDVLIEVSLARGRWAAKYMKDATSAFNDLNEVLGYAVDAGYRIYEADIRVALAWANAVDSQQSTVDSKQKAKAEAERALKMSEEMGYYWGKVDAAEVLAVASRQSPEKSGDWRLATVD